VVFSVRTLAQAFCARIFAFYVLTKDKAMLFVSCAVYVLVRPMLPAAKSYVVNHQVKIFVIGYSRACTCIKFNEREWSTLWIGTRSKHVWGNSDQTPEKFEVLFFLVELDSFVFLPLDFVANYFCNGLMFLPFTQFPCGAIATYVISIFPLYTIKAVRTWASKRGVCP
jgi:hypothetical protein